MNYLWMPPGNVRKWRGGSILQKTLHNDNGDSFKLWISIHADHLIWKQSTYFAKSDEDESFMDLLMEAFSRRLSAVKWNFSWLPPSLCYAHLNTPLYCAKCCRLRLFFRVTGRACRNVFYILTIETSILKSIYTWGPLIKICNKFAVHFVHYRETIFISWLWLLWNWI